MRTISIALETYYMDNNTYPAWSANTQKNAFHGLRDKEGKLSHLPTFRIQNGSALATLTTPVAYINTFFPDRFLPIKGAAFCYWGWSGDAPENPKGVGFILWSAGPDGIYDLTLDNVARAYQPKETVPSALLIDLAYDPSNGTRSRGDVYRYKQ